MKYGKQMLAFVLLTITESMENAKAVQELLYMSPALRLAEINAPTGKFGLWINANVSQAAIL